MATRRFQDCTYSIVGGIRSVLPYVHEFKSYAKGRWLGRELLEVLVKEFGAHPQSYWKTAIKHGHVRVNNRVVAENYKFRNSDELLHRTHR
jgi:tRNA pseudouridine32 synthase